MRTTLTINEDIFEKIHQLAKRLGQPFKVTLNEALRAGIRQMAVSKAAKPYKTKSHAMGLKPGFSLDNIQDVLSELDAEFER